jgi:hypothetical protein
MLVARYPANSRPQRQLNHPARSEHPISSRLNDALFLYRRVKLSRLSLLFCADCIALLLGIKHLAKCERLASNLPYKFFSKSKITTRRDFLPERFTLESFGWGDVSLAPVLGEPREQSKEFKPLPKSNLYCYLNDIV